MFQKKEKVQAGEQEAQEKLNKDATPEKKTANVFREQEEKKTGNQPSNRVLRGSKICGDIRVSCDLDVSGDVDGNISSDTDANVNIQGLCKGNIKTGGNVVISGSLCNGDILSSGTVTIIGKFQGGTIRANNKIHIDGEFQGKLESKEVVIGAKAQGKGEIVYEEHFSVARGAKLEGQIVSSKIEAVGKKEILAVTSSEQKPQEKKVAQLVVQKEA